MYCLFEIWLIWNTRIIIFNLGRLILNIIRHVCLFVCIRTINISRQVLCLNRIAQFQCEIVNNEDATVKLLKFLSTIYCYTNYANIIMILHKQKTEYTVTEKTVGASYTFVASIERGETSGHTFSWHFRIRLWRHVFGITEW